MLNAKKRARIENAKFFGKELLMMTLLKNKYVCKELVLRVKGMYKRLMLSGG